MDELEQTGTPAEESARPAAAPARGSAPARRAAGTVYNPALAQTTVTPAKSAGISQPVKVALAVGVGIVCFVLGFWAVQMLSGGGSHKKSTASLANSSSAGATQDRAIEATGAADIANGLSGGSARRAPAERPAPPPPSEVDVKAKPPVVFRPFETPDPKQLELLAPEDWLPTAPFAMKYPKNYYSIHRSVGHPDDPELKTDEGTYQKQDVPRGVDPQTFTILVQRRTNKRFPPVFTHATSAIKWGIGPNDPQDKLLVFDGEKVEFGSIDGMECVRAYGKDSLGRDSATYCMLDSNWFLRIDMSNVPPGSADFQLLDAMVRTLHHKDPKQQ